MKIAEDHLETLHIMKSIGFQKWLKIICNDILIIMSHQEIIGEINMDHGQKGENEQQQRISEWCRINPIIRKFYIFWV